MKNLKSFATIVFFCISTLCMAQNFNEQLEKLAQELAEKINVKEKAKVALWGFISENDNHKEFEHFLAEDFSIYLSNHAENFALIDRAHLHLILKEHRLNAEGYIDENTTKRLGKIIAADAVVVGTFTVLNSDIRVRIKVLDTETALQFAGCLGNLPINDNVAEVLGKL